MYKLIISKSISKKIEKDDNDTSKSPDHKTKTFGEKSPPK